MSSYKFLSVVFTILLFASFTGAYEQEIGCNHDSEEFNPDFMQVDDLPTEEDGRLLASYPKMRLYAHFDTLKSGSKSFRSYVQYDLVPPVIAYFESALRIKYPLKTKMTVTSSTLCGATTPSILKSSGVSADHFFFFTAAAESGNFIATSTYCKLSTDTKRPIISRVKLNTNILKAHNGDPLIHEKNIYLLMHEFVHSFGFSKNLYKYFLDDKGKTRSGHIKSVSLHGNTRTVLNIPSLTSKVRSHFGCSSLPGVYLENNGDSTLTAGSHLERKHYLLDFMTSGSLDAMRVTEFSLGVLEASGWYSPDYDYAEPNHYGAGQGCGFINNKCSSSGSSFDEFCSKTKERGCSVSGRAGGKCNSDKLSDGCKYYSPSINYDCHNPDAKDVTRVPELQTFGREAGSKCFEGTLSNKKGDSLHSFCFKYSCQGKGSSTTVEVQVGKRKVVCTKEGGVSVSGYQGTISCPDPLTFCQTVGKNYCPRNCMGRGRCSNNKCVCNNGFTGIDCSERI
jgi:leishmanolysin